MSSIIGSEILLIIKSIVAINGKQSNKLYYSPFRCFALARQFWNLSKPRCSFVCIISTNFSEENSFMITAYEGYDD